MNLRKLHNPLEVIRETLATISAPPTPTPAEAVAICAWCQTERGIKPKPGSSHGICNRHREEMRGQAIKELQQVQQKVLDAHRLPKAAPILAAVLFLAAFTTQAAIASWYGEDHRGLPMANCKPFNPDAMTCASWFYPLGSKLKISKGRKSVIVTVTDRGPNHRLVKDGRTIDLSASAFCKLANPDLGLIPVKIERINRK